MFSTDFSAALERALSSQRRKGVLRAVGITALATVVAALSVWLLDTLLVALALAVAVGLSWLRLLLSAPPPDGLAWLRGAQPEHWLESPSHGLLVIAEDHLTCDGLPRVALGTKASRRVTSIGFDEQRHVVNVQITDFDPPPSTDPEFPPDTEWQAQIQLATSVSRERAQAFINHVRERAPAAW